jgi:antitoxin ParD1/3/4
MSDTQKVQPELSPEDIRRLRRLWDEGKDSGPAKPLDLKRTLAVARARLKKAREE